MSVHGGMPVEAAAECRRQLPRRQDIGVAVQDVGDLVGVLALHAIERQLGEARRHVQSGAVRVNDSVIDDDKLVIGDNALLGEGVIKLSVGKKRHALIKPV